MHPSLAEVALGTLGTLCLRWDHLELVYITGKSNGWSGAMQPVLFFSSLRHRSVRPFLVLCRSSSLLPNSMLALWLTAFMVPPVLAGTMRKNRRRKKKQDSIPVFASLLYVPSRGSASRIARVRGVNIVVYRCDVITYFSFHRKSHLTSFPISHTTSLPFFYPITSSHLHPYPPPTHHHPYPNIPQTSISTHSTNWTTLALRACITTDTTTTIINNNLQNNTRTTFLIRPVSTPRWV